MSREALTDEQKQRGRALGQAIRRLRGNKAAEDLAVAAGVRLDTLRKFEQGRIPTPGFFFIADVAWALKIDLDGLNAETQRTPTEDTP